MEECSVTQNAEVAPLLRALLAKVASGELPAGGRRGAAIVKRLEGVVLGLEVGQRKR
jgi:hypothetical protein